ncbi:MAG: FecR domain-containing protein [Planctomycetaceae bacterium]|nr:FecR domain-containing protein [Planctomycetaceae bacterium]
MNKQEKSAERDIFRRLADGTLSAEEFAGVEQRLLADPAFRRRYVRAMGVEGAMHEAFRFPGTYRESNRRRLSAVRVFVYGGLCAALLLGVAGWSFVAFGPRGPSAVYESHASAGTRPVAIVTKAQLASGGMKPGLRIKPGILKVDEGQVQIEFLNGAQINLEGPAELRVHSVDSATLVSGKAAARIPPGARGFILNTPDAAIVDLGTEFAVAVGDAGESEIHVVEGQVDVSLLGSDGNTLTSQRMSEASSLRLTRRPSALERIDTPSVKFPGVEAQVSTTLEVTEEYSQAVRASRPDVYWRFDRLDGGLVPNEAGADFSGRIHTHPEDASAVVVGDGVARFLHSDWPRRIEAENAVPGLNRESFSIELWACLDNFHWATFAAVVPDSISDRNLHLALLELPYKSSMVFTPGSYRFMFRHPAGDHGGTNLFTNGDCTPGLWHHLVAVKSPNGMKLYLNGKMLREIAENAGGDELPYRLYLGELYEGQTDRQLSGSIDEFALYLRELGDDEISSHYRAMFGP